MRRRCDVRQAEVAECGLAALVMLARHHGHDIDMAWARQRFPRGTRRPDLSTLLDQAAALGLEARALRAELSELRHLRLPAILHWDFRHFVVLTRVRRRRFDIADPAAGRRHIRRRRMAEGYTGVAVEFARGRGFTGVRGRRRLHLADLLGAFRGLRRYLAAVLLLLLATQLLGLAVPVGTQLLVDEVVRGQDRQWLYAVVAGLGCVMAAAIVLETLRQHYGLYAGVRVSLDLAAGFVRHILALPVAVIERRTTADTLSRVDSLQPVQHVLTETSLAAAVQAASLLAAVGLMLFYSPLLAMLSLATLVVLVLLQAVVLPRTRSHHLDGVIAQAEARQSLLESLAAAASLRAFGLAAARTAHWQNAFVRATNARVAQGRLAIAASAGQGALAAADQLAFLAVGVAAIGNGSLTLGALFAFVTLRGRLAAATAGLVAAASDFYLLRNHLDRVGELLAERIEAPAAPAALRRVPTGRLGCSGLAYAWQRGDSLFAGLECAVDAGERVVLCGPSGIGKTTLLRLLATELEAGEGSVHYDGWDTAFWDGQALRRHLGVVRQADRLFTGTIADNIAGFAPLPDLPRVRHAAELACIWDDLLALPMRLETPLADGGAGLSGGQHQRLLIARALYRAPRVLFLDEATSQLDERTERRVLENLAGLGVTIVSVAHGPQAIRLGGRPLCLARTGRGKSIAALS